MSGLPDILPAPPPAPASSGTAASASSSGSHAPLSAAPRNTVAQQQTDSELTDLSDVDEYARDDNGVLQRIETGRPRRAVSAIPKHARRTKGNIPIIVKSSPARTQQRRGTDSRIVSKKSSSHIAPVGSRERSESPSSQTPPARRAPREASTAKPITSYASSSEDEPLACSQPKRRPVAPDDSSTPHGPSAACNLAVPAPNDPSFASGSDAPSVEFPTPAPTRSSKPPPSRKSKAPVAADVPGDVADDEDEDEDEDVPLALGLKVAPTPSTPQSTRSSLSLSPAPSGSRKRRVASTTATSEDDAMTSDKPSPPKKSSKRTPPIPSQEKSTPSIPDVAEKRELRRRTTARVPVAVTLSPTKRQVKRKPQIPPSATADARASTNSAPVISSPSHSESVSLTIIASTPTAVSDLPTPRDVQPPTTSDDSPLPADVATVDTPVSSSSTPHLACSTSSPISACSNPPLPSDSPAAPEVESPTTSDVSPCAPLTEATPNAAAPAVPAAMEEPSAELKLPDLKEDPRERAPSAVNAAGGPSAGRAAPELGTDKSPRDMLEMFDSGRIVPERIQLPADGGQSLQQPVPSSPRGRRPTASPSLSHPTPPEPQPPVLEPEPLLGLFTPGTGEFAPSVRPATVVAPSATSPAAAVGPASPSANPTASRAPDVPTLSYASTSTQKSPSPSCACCIDPQGAQLQQAANNTPPSNGMSFRPPAPGPNPAPRRSTDAVPLRRLLTAPVSPNLRLPSTGISPLHQGIPPPPPPPPPTFAFYPPPPLPFIPFPPRASVATTNFLPSTNNLPSTLIYPSSTPPVAQAPVPRASFPKPGLDPPGYTADALADLFAPANLPPLPTLPRKPKKPSVPKVRKAPKVQPEFTIDKSDWILPPQLSMIEISPPIVLYSQKPGAKAEKNPHRHRSGVVDEDDGEVEDAAPNAVGPVPPALKIKVDERDLGPVKFINQLPPIWCMGRQELCEALYKFFNSYQGGHYDKGGRCYGYLLDGFPSPMDACADDGRVILSHGGGCSDVTKDEGYHLKTDQLRDGVRVRSLINCWKAETPVVLIAGSSYKFFPRLEETKIRYAVLGNYYVSDVWAEAEPTGKHSSGYFVRFKVRFEWVPSQGEPWFHNLIGGTPSSLPATPVQSSQLTLTDMLNSPSRSGDAPAPPSFLDPPTQLHKTTCSECHMEVRSVYEEDIACYNETCSEFFLLNGKIANPAELKIRAPFLIAYGNPTWSNLVPQPLTPNSMAQVVEAGADYTHEGWKAFHCSSCGRISSRSEWHRLVCECCGASVPTVCRRFLPREVSKSIGVVDFSVKKDPSILRQPIVSCPGYVGWTYHLSPTARVHHLRKEDQADLVEADRFFDAYQNPDTSKFFSRNALSVHKLPGELLCSHFSFNCGEEYKFSANGLSFPFDQAPAFVIEEKELISHISKLVVADAKDADFNELLQVAYMEGGRMNYHDDGESGLGPIVSTFSLGGEATMTFRKKKKKASKKGGKSKKGSTSGIALDGLSLAGNGSDLGDGEASGGEDAAPRRAPQRKTLLNLKLQHGDFTVMEGPDTQKYFEHAVTLDGGLRFAATCRFIGPDH